MVDLTKDLAAIRSQLGTINTAVTSLSQSLSSADAGAAAAEVEATSLRSQLQDAQAKLAALQPPPPSPVVKTITFDVIEPLGQKRVDGEYVSVGLPLAENLGVTSIAQLCILDPRGVPVAADIRPTGWWRTKKAPDGIQWAHVMFPVSGLGANASLRYSLQINGAENPAPAKTITISTVAGQMFIDTGVSLANLDIRGVTAGIAVGRGLSATFESIAGDQNPIPRRMEVEYAGPLVAYVIVEGTLPHFFNGGGISFRRRYEFRAGEEKVFVSEKVQWEGSWNGMETLKPDKTSLNAILGTAVVHKLGVDGTVLDLKVYAETAVGPVSVGKQEAHLSQNLRDTRLVLDPAATGKYLRRVPLSYSGSGASGTLAGEEATGGMLSVQTDQGTVTAALRQMHRYEPQALVFRNGTLELQLASDRFWLAFRQGVHFRYALSFSSSVDFPDFWRQLNAPLRGLAPASVYGNSLAVASIPDGALPAALAPLDAILAQTVQATDTWRSNEGLQGLMTWGLWPRYWGEWGLGTGETGKGLGPWDDLYKNGTWTDYWCASKIGVEAAIRLRQPKWIDELVIPAALRMLHTQIIQGAPDDPNFYVGQAAIGYGAYRSDFNSSHQYWENLFWYYFITGDRSVIETLERGARAQANFIRTQGTVSGRQPHQWILTLRFLAHCSTAKDIDFGAVFEEFAGRTLKETYLSAPFNGVQEAIWIDGRFSGPGTYETTSGFSMGFYDMDTLYWFAERTGNASVNGVRPMDALVNVARTYLKFGGQLAGNATSDWAGNWCRGFTVDYDGAKFTRIVQSQKDAEPVLYPDDKPAMASWLSRAATFSGDASIAKASAALVQWAYKRMLNRSAPMGKLVGLALGRLTAAVVEERKRS